MVAAGSKREWQSSYLERYEHLFQSPRERIWEKAGEILGIAERNRSNYLHRALRSVPISLKQARLSRSSQCSKPR